MSDCAPRKPLRLAAFLGLGCFAGLLSFAAAALLSAGGHGSDVGYLLAFPFSETLHRMNPGARNQGLLVGLAVAQMPFYGLILGSVWDGRHRFHACVILVLVHFAAIGAAVLAGLRFASYL